MHTVGEYRRAAEAAKRLASQAIDEGERRALLRIAAEWEHLADYRENRAKKRSAE
jgi:hypothetical protein